MTALLSYSQGNQVGTSDAPIDALLGPLANNGGPTQTMALLPGSPAIDRGGPDAGLEESLTTDERGFSRVNDLAYLLNSVGGDGRDIGAYEVDGTPAPTILTVNSTADASPPPGVLTLRQAIEAADGSIPLTSLPPGQVSAGTAYHFIINLAVTGKIDVATNLPALLGSVELDGPGASALTIQSDGSNLELEVGPGANVTISSLTLLGHLTSNGLTVRMDAEAALNSSIVSGNSAGIGAGIDVEDGRDVNRLAGRHHRQFRGEWRRCIEVGSWRLPWEARSRLSASQSTISGNGGGGIYFQDVKPGSGVPDVLNVSRSAITGNTANSDGGGIRLGELSNAAISDSTIADNQATGNGGGVFTAANASLSLTRSTVAGNVAGDGGTGSGGGLFISPTKPRSSRWCQHDRSSVEHSSGAALVRGPLTTVSGALLVSTGSYDLISDGARRDGAWSKASTATRWGRPRRRSTPCLALLGEQRSVSNARRLALMPGSRLPEP